MTDENEYTVSVSGRVNNTITNQVNCYWRDEEIEYCSVEDGPTITEAARAAIYGTPDGRRMM